MMQIFYAPGIEGGFFTLNERESKHSVRVLRMKKGEEVQLIDGKGNLYQGIITDPDPKKCLIKIVSVVKDFETRNYRLHIAISPLKNPERFEWFIEKSVEIGIDEITPVICKNSEKSGIKTDRVENIIVSAMKQSLKARSTILHEPCKFTDFIEQDHKGIRMIAHCNTMFDRYNIDKVYHRSDDALIIIGPEGDFTNDEIEHAAGKDFFQVHLGKSRLRSETAGIAACHLICFINQ